jgi:hypothetical protein
VSLVFPERVLFPCLTVQLFLYRHAANVLVFPHGEWCAVLVIGLRSVHVSLIVHSPPAFYCRLGRLRPTDVPGVLDTVMEPPSHTNLARTSLLTHWRGQMGLTKEEQLERYRLAMR